MDSLRWHPAARAEFIEATVYLERHRPGYGLEFADAVEEMLERIIQLPESGPHCPVIHQSSMSARFGCGDFRTP